MRTWLATLLVPVLALLASYSRAQVLGTSPAPPAKPVLGFEELPTAPAAPGDQAAPMRPVLGFEEVLKEPGAPGNQAAPRRHTQAKTQPGNGGVVQPDPPLEASCIFDCGRRACLYPSGRTWGYAEYLLWWTRGSSVPALATASPAGTPLADAAVLGKPGTVVLFGNERVDDDVRSGGRFTLGTWLNLEQTFGVEGSFFFLENQATHFSIASDGIPIIGRPFFDVNAGANTSVKIGFPNFVRGSLDISTSSSLLGAEVYFRQALECGCCWRLDLIGGYRYLRLDEDLQLRDIEIGNDPQGPLFGIPIDIQEAFRTANDFHGGEVGLIAESQRGRWYVRGVAKVALGCTRRTARISGTTQVDGFDIETGGVLALPSNIGRYQSTVFSAVPEAGISVGYDVTRRLRVFGGYSFLYWGNVARPGDQIDLRVNTTQPPLGGGLVGLALPAFNFRYSDFWAQGVSFGLEFRF